MINSVWFGPSVSNYDQHYFKLFPCKREGKYKKPLGRPWEAALFHWSVQLVPGRCHLIWQTTRGGDPSLCRQGSRAILETRVICSRTRSQVREVFWVELQDCGAFLWLPCLPGNFIWYIIKVGWLGHRVYVCASEGFFFPVISGKIQRNW